MQVGRIPEGFLSDLQDTEHSIAFLISVGIPLTHESSFYQQLAPKNSLRYRTGTIYLVRLWSSQPPPGHGLVMNQHNCPIRWRLSTPAGLFDLL